MYVMLCQPFIRMKNVSQLEITLTPELCVFVEKKKYVSKKWLQEKPFKNTLCDFARDELNWN